MLGAFAMVVLAIDLELPYWLSILITLAVLVGFGALFNLAVYYPCAIAASCRSSSAHRGFDPVENGVLAAYVPRPQSLDACLRCRL